MVGKAASGRSVGRTLPGRESLFVRGGRGALRILFLALLLATLCVAGAPKLDDDRAAWRDACKLSGYSCVWIKAPLVARAPLEGLYGRYRMGDAYILVSEDIDGKFAYAVKVHEMVHYLQYKHGAWKYTKENSCAMERDAFIVSNAVLERLGETEGLVDWNAKRIQYGCAA